MRNMMGLTREEKEKLVLDLYYIERKTYAEIAKEARISLRDIGPILKKSGTDQSLSDSSQAYQLFLEGKSPIQVAIKLGLKEPEVHELYRQYWNLEHLYGLHQVYENTKSDIQTFLELYRLIKAAGMDLKHVMRLLEIANNELPKVEQIYKNLHRDVMNLNLKKRDAEATILKLNDDIIHLRNATESQRLECEKQESEKRNLYLRKIRLESVINQLQNSEEYTKMEMIVKQQVDKVLGEDKQLLRLAFESIIESLLKDPFRLQSYFQYAMSVTPTSTLSYTAIDNCNHEGQRNFYDQCYLSPNYEEDCKQVECFRTLILNESENLYNQKIEEFTNMACIWQQQNTINI